MSTKVNGCVDVALAYADDPKHNGEGYSVEVELDTGRIVVGKVVYLDEPHPDTLILTQDHIQGTLKEVFIDKRRVVSIAINW